jgi:colicin import membrane protein
VIVPVGPCTRLDIYKAEGECGFLQCTPLQPYQNKTQKPKMSTPAELKARLLAEREARRAEEIARREAEQRREEEEARELEQRREEEEARELERLEELEREEEERKAREEEEQRVREEAERRARLEADERRRAEEKREEERKREEEERKAREETERQERIRREQQGNEANPEGQRVAAATDAEQPQQQRGDTIRVSQPTAGSSKDGGRKTEKGCWHCRSREIRCVPNG